MYFEAVKLLLSRFSDWENCDMYNYISNSSDWENCLTDATVIFKKVILFMSYAENCTNVEMDKYRVIQSKEV